MHPHAALSLSPDPACQPERRMRGRARLHRRLPMSQTNTSHHPIVHIERPDPNLSVRIVSCPTSPLEVIASAWSELTALRSLQLLDASCNYIMVGKDTMQRLLARVGEASKP